MSPGARLLKITAWLGWWLSLFVCPIAIEVIAIANLRTNAPWSDPTYDPWPSELVDNVYAAHFAVSALAAVIALLFARGAFRWIALAGDAAMLVVAWFIHFGAAIATTGILL
jgi:hypothetical protein